MSSETCRGGSGAPTSTSDIPVDGEYGVARRAFDRPSGRGAAYGSGLDEGAVRLISIPRHSGTDSLDDMLSALGHAGCLAVTGLADQPARSRVVAELASHLEAAPVKTDDDPAAFYPGLTHA